MQWEKWGVSRSVKITLPAINQGKSKMAVGKFETAKRREVLVGIRFDGHTKELLDWALVKVADAGDHVVAIHVRRNSDSISKGKGLLDDYLEDYQGLCNQKQVTLSAEVLKGNSFRKALVNEAKNRTASAVIVGITKNSTLGGCASVAKYCAKQLPPTVEVMAIHNGKFVFRRSPSGRLEGQVGDPKPSFYPVGNTNFKDNRSEYSESEISEMERLSCDGFPGSDLRKEAALGRSLQGEVVSSFQRRKGSSLRSISLPQEDISQQRPGWPLLLAGSSTNHPALEARKMSVVQWVMTLPHRSLYEVSESNSTLNKDESTRESADHSRIETSCWDGLPKDLELILKTNAAECKLFTYDVLKTATSQFSSENLIGKGGCNSVYKGFLPEGKQVAVKILKSSKEGWKYFILEIDILTTLKHKRILPLLGICFWNDDLIPVYDFIPKGSLEENLHGNRKESCALQWGARFNIAVGVAESLDYLHNKCPRPVIHRDVKSANILLTDELEPQLSDFGLAIWGPTTAPFLTDSDVVGTFGYLAPEYFMYGKVSEKIDVYAFGVVLLELLSGRRPIGVKNPKGQESLVLWAKPILDAGDFKSLLDPNFEKSTIDETQMEGMALAAKLCLTQAARTRPKMCQVLSILRGQNMNDAVRTQHENENENQEYDDDDDEVYPDSSVESHLSLALLDVTENSTSFCSLDQSGSPLSVEDYIKRRWSRSSSLE